MPHRALCSTLVSLLLAACSTNTPLPDLRKEVPAAWRNAPTKAELPPGPTPDMDSWWHAFDDVQLDGLIERALQENLSLQQAQWRLRGARAMQHHSGTQFEPQVNFHTFAQPDPNGSTSYFEIGFDAVWEFGFFGRGLANARIAQADTATAETDIVAAKVSVIAEVARSYMDLRAAQARAAILDRVVNLRRQRADMGKVRLRWYLGSRVDAERLDAELAQAQADAAEPVQAIIEAQQALALLLAETEPDASLLASGPQPVLPDVTFTQTPADLLRTRPEVRKAELNVLRVAGELGVAKADLYPKLALGGSLTSSTRMVGDVDRPNKGIPAVGPLIDIPLFDWGARRDVVHARDAELAAAALEYRQTVLAGLAEAESALAQWHRQQQRVTAADKMLSTSEHAATSAHSMQRIGLADAGDSTAADAATAQARLDRAQAEHDASLAFIAVYKSFGGSLPPLQTDTR